MASPMISKCAQVGKLASKNSLVPSISLSPRSAGISPHPTPLVFSPSPDGVKKSPIRLSISLGFGPPRNSSALLSPSSAIGAVKPQSQKLPEECSKDLHTPVTRRANGCGFSFSPGNSMLRRYAQTQFRTARDSSTQSPNLFNPWVEAPCNSPVVALALSGTKNCSALIHSPCRSDRYKKQRRRLYHQDSCDAIPVDQLLKLGLSGDTKTPSRLGSGSFGSVFFGKYDNKRVAIKQFYRTPEFADKSFSAELNAFRLDHPNIVKILTFTCQANHTQVVFEYVGSKNLQQFLDDEAMLVPFDRRHKICSQVASALAFCHGNRILHLDVKPSNILMTDEGDCKLGDFGCSRRLPGDSDHLAVTPKLQQVGTLIYKAPELLKGHPATTKADVYSFGYVTWQCCTRKLPFDGENLHTVVFCVVSKNLRPPCGPTALARSTVPKFDAQLMSLAEDCWQADPLCRPEFSQVEERLSALLIDYQTKF